MCPPEIYKRTVPVNARAYLRGVFGNTDPIDETFFRSDELDVLRESAGRAMSRSSAATRRLAEIQELAHGQGREKWPHLVEHEEDLARPVLDYRDYGADLGALPSLSQMLFGEPGAKLATTLGQAGIDRDEAGNTVLTDQYDFNSFGHAPPTLGDAVAHLVRFDPYLALRAAGGALVPEGAGFPIRVNLGKIEGK